MIALLWSCSRKIICSDIKLLYKDIEYTLKRSLPMDIIYSINVLIEKDDIDVNSLTSNDESAVDIFLDEVYFAYKNIMDDALEEILIKLIKMSVPFKYKKYNTHKILELLSEHTENLDQNGVDTCGVSSLEGLIESNGKSKLEILKHIIEKGIDVNMLTSNKVTPLKLALDNEYCSGAELLLEAGAKLNLSG